MTKEDYKVQPVINSPRDLLVFLQQIPAQFWCVDIRDDLQGRHCVLGHLDNVYGYENGRDGFNNNELATVNNGTVAYSYGPRKPGTKTTGQAIKNRVLKFIRSRI